MKTRIASIISMAIACAPSSRFIAEPKPMRDEGLPPPGIFKLGAKASNYRPSPNGAPKCGSKRRRQWR